MDLADAIRTLAEELQLPDIAPDEDGSYSIVFDGDLVLEILPWDNRTFLMRTTLVPLPSEPEKEKLMVQRVLQFSLAKLRCRLTSTSLDPASRRLILSRVLQSTALRPFEFIAAVEDFLNDIELWMKFLESGAATSPGGNASYTNSSQAYQPMMIIMP
ncbi:MAG TPA: CesT family type III secretion system chaperone [Candidatus Methylacidiphilales bacterium]|nr:CesT family type III secretion system chaperone [Candidatus Methylacidiphilales bacterium]